MVGERRFGRQVPRAPGDNINDPFLSGSFAAGETSLPLRPTHFLAGVAKSRSLFVATPPSWPRYVRDQGRVRIGTHENGKWSGRGDLNSRPLGPEPSALPGCATPRMLIPVKHQASTVNRLTNKIQKIIQNVQFLQ